MIIGYNKSQKQVFVDWTSSGVSNFNEKFAARHFASLKTQKDKIKLHILLDHCSVELFANDGLITITDLIFPETKINNIQLDTKSGRAVIDTLKIYKLESIW